MIKINGEQLELDSISLEQYINEKKMDPKKIAVECNEIIVPKSEYKSFIIHSGDVVEIVSLVGGG